MTQNGFYFLLPMNQNQQKFQRNKNLQKTEKEMKPGTHKVFCIERQRGQSSVCAFQTTLEGNNVSKNSQFLQNSWERQQQNLYVLQTNLKN